MLFKHANGFIIDVWCVVVSCKLLQPAAPAHGTLLKSYSPAAMSDCTYCLNWFFIPQFSEPYAAFLLRSSRHSLIAKRLQCSQLVERSTLHAAFFAASNEFISFPLHSFARHQHTHTHIYMAHPCTQTQTHRETLRSQFHCSAATSPGQDEHHSDIATSCTQTRTSARWWWHCQNAKSTQHRERSSKYECECESESESVTELVAGRPVPSTRSPEPGPVRSAPAFPCAVPFRCALLASNFRG